MDGVGFDCWYVKWIDLRGLEDIMTRVGGCNVDVIRRMMRITCGYVDGGRCSHVDGTLFEMMRNDCIGKVRRWCDV